MRKSKLRWLWYVTLIACGYAMSVMGSTAVSVGPFTFNQSTGYNMTVVIQRSIAPTINGTVIATGDVIAAYTPSGLCVGAISWPDSGNVIITVWGDDDQTPVVDGAVSGDSLSFRVWDSSAGLVGKAMVTWLPIGSIGINSAYTYGTNVLAGFASFAGIVTPAAPALTVPINGDTGSSAMKQATVALTWGTVAGAATYRVQVSTTSTFAKPAVDDSTLTVCSKACTTLRNTTYYWRVSAKNTSGTSAWTAMWRFKTTSTGIITVQSHYSPITLGHSGVLELYQPNGACVMANAYEATATKTQLLNAASKTLPKGYYLYRFRSTDAQVNIVGKLIR